MNETETIFCDGVNIDLVFFLTRHIIVFRLEHAIMSFTVLLLLLLLLSLLLLFFEKEIDLQCHKYLKSN